MKNIDRLGAILALILSIGAVTTWIINMNVAVAANAAGIIHNEEKIDDHYELVETIVIKIDRMYEGMIAKGIIEPVN